MIMRKILLLISAVLLLANCKQDVGLERENTSCLNIFEAKKKKVLNSVYITHFDGFLKEFKIVEAWSEKSWSFHNGKMVVDENKYNFNVRFQFVNQRYNFSNYSVFYSPNEYFSKSSYISSIYKSEFKHSRESCDTIRLTLHVNGKNVPISFLKKNIK